MKKFNILVITGFVLFMVIFSYFAQKSHQELNPMPIEPDQGNGESFLETIIFHQNRPKTSSNKVTKSGADSDRSQCDSPPTAEKKVITKFAGYILEYPCTAGDHGSIRIEYNENKMVSQQYMLYLGLLLGSEKKSIWKQTYDESSKNVRESFLIILKSNGKHIPIPPLIERLKKTVKVKTIEPAGLDIYFNSNTNHIIALLKDFKDASGHSPVISCLINRDEKIENLFTDLYNVQYKYQSCSAHWMLTSDISLTVHSFKAKYAYHFKDLYPVVNSGLQQIIVEKPATVPLENQE